jgi:hypothetical protein
MFIAIIQSTPGWVWGLLAAVALLGLAQTRTRTLSQGRVTVLPVVLAALSLAGTMGSFGFQAMPLTAWMVGFALVWRCVDHAAHLRNAHGDAATGRVTVPGSWIPLGLILGIFLLKYGSGVSLALHPRLQSDALFAVGVSVASGAFSGAFWGRARILRKLAAGFGHALAA